MLEYALLAFKYVCVKDMLKKDKIILHQQFFFCIVPIINNLCVGVSFDIKSDWENFANVLESSNAFLRMTNAITKKACVFSTDNLKKEMHK